MMRMEGSSEEWTEKHRPKKLSGVVGNVKATEELNEWADGIDKAKSKKAALLHGPPGCGKTSTAYALASERGWEVIELNASDQRNAGVIKSIVGPASTSTTFSKTTRLIILDEADNLHGNEDRGGTKAITELVKRSTQPIILIANDKYRMGNTLPRYCKAIKFMRIKPGTIFRVLRAISDEEGIEISDDALLILAKNANGDMRSAINDLHALSLSRGGKGIEEHDIATGERDVDEDIFAVLTKIFGGHDMQKALFSLYGIDKTPEEIIQWIYRNFSYDDDEESFLHGLHYLSRADTFLGRARSSENFKFWRYASSLMACGVLSAKEMQGAEGRQRRYFRSPWQREQSGVSRKSAPIREEIAKKVGAYYKVPLSYARFFVLPFLSLLFRDEQKAVAITTSLRLNVPQIVFLVGDPEGEEKAKRIYQEAIAVGKEVKREGRNVVKSSVGEEKILKTKTEEGEAVENEEKNQKTLADFF
jgi:replication factor C large subunit